MCVTSAKPCSCPTRSAQASTSGPATSTVRPHARHHQVVVVLVGGAPAVDRLTAVGAQHVHLTRVRERLQVPVHGRQPDVRPVMAQDVVQFLRAAKAVGGQQR